MPTQSIGAQKNKDRVMQDWMLPHVTSYWDERVDAIERFSRLIEATPEGERAAELSALSAAVGR